MIDGVTILINGIVNITMISEVDIVTMISGIFIWKIVGGPVKDTSILKAVVLLHEVVNVNLVEGSISLSMR